jgi:hypothetical protein
MAPDNIQQQLMDLQNDNGLTEKFGCMKRDDFFGLL